VDSSLIDSIQKVTNWLSDEDDQYYRDGDDKCQASSLGAIWDYVQVKVGDIVDYMVALWNRAGHYIFAPWFLSFFLLSIFLFLFSSLNLSGRRSDVYHTFTHGVALVRI